ncbi:unnamed protein product, partial [Diamesa tonsa]
KQQQRKKKTSLIRSLCSILIKENLSIHLNTNKQLIYSPIDLIHFNLNLILQIQKKEIADVGIKKENIKIHTHTHSNHNNGE